MTCVRDVDEMMTEERAELASEHTFARAAFASKRNRDLRRFSGTLNGRSHPIEEVPEVLRVPTANVVVDMVRQ